MLLDDVVLTTPRCVLINHAARDVLRENGVVTVRIERVSSLTSAERQHLGLLD